MCSDKQFENMMNEMVDFTAETLSEEEVVKRKLKLKDTLYRFKDMLSSSEFKRKCKAQSKKYGVNDKLIKNMYAQNILNTIGESIGVVIEVVGEAFDYLVRFIGYIIQRVMDVTVSILTKLVNAVTFRKSVEE